MSASLAPSADRLRSAGWLIVGVIIMIFVCLITVALDGIRGIVPPPVEAVALYRTIGLNELALVPAGQLARRTEALPVSIDGRYLPTLPLGNPGVVPMMDADRLAAPGKAMP
jgi:hypothetical protein